MNQSTAIIINVIQIIKNEDNTEGLINTWLELTQVWDFEFPIYKKKKIKERSRTFFFHLYTKHKSHLDCNQEMFEVKQDLCENGKQVNKVCQCLPL